MYIGKEVVVMDVLCSFGNSSYAQFSWLYLGPDTAHKQLMVFIKGDVYLKGTKKWAGDYVGKKVQIRGIVKRNKDIYLEANDTLKFN